MLWTAAAQNYLAGFSRVLVSRVHGSDLLCNRCVLQQKRHMAALSTQKAGNSKKTKLFGALFGFPLSELLNAAVHLCCVPDTPVSKTVMTNLDRRALANALSRSGHDVQPARWNSPRVVTARACVSPQVMREPPRTLGRQPALLQMGRTSVTPLQSTWYPSSSTSLLVA